MKHLIVRGTGRGNNNRPYICNHKHRRIVNPKAQAAEAAYRAGRPYPRLGSYYIREPDGSSGTTDLTEVDCTECLVLYDAWLASLAAKPPMPRYDDLPQVFAHAKKEYVR